jgi:hypothetical protein
MIWGATEYTLVTLVVDTTSSVIAFADELLKCVKKIVHACKKNPRAENLLLRLLTFNSKLTEVHGFKPLSSINPEDYKPFKPSGMTALYDAAYSGISATVEMAKQLSIQDFSVNGCVYIITDGMDNSSKVTAKTIAKKVQETLKEEEIDSLITILVELINSNDPYAQSVRGALTTFEVQAQLSQFIDAGDATPQKLARLAYFVSQSISSQSQALSTGAVSQSLQF